VPAEEVHAITHRNAMRLFRYEPFSVIPEADCTVGALRAQAVDVDTVARPSGRTIERPDSPIRIIDLAERVAAKKD
jgi:hypothetical protein